MTTRQASEEESSDVQALGKTTWLIAVHKNAVGEDP